MQPNVSRTAALRTGLEELGDALEAASFHLPGLKCHEAEQRDLIRTVREYLLPRLRDPDSPVVAAIVGLGGVGKSSLLNGLAGRDVSPAGPVRPTTTNPVVWAHREHAGRYWSDFVARVRERAGPHVDVVVGDDPLTDNLTLIDTPSLDFVNDDDRLPAAEVVSVADLCIVVTSPARYADAAGWDFMHRIHRRGLPMLFVLNRTTEAERTEVRADWARRLADAGMLLNPSPSSVFTVADRGLGANSTALQAIRKELGELADPAVRNRLAGQSSSAAVRGLLMRSYELADVLESDAEAAERLREVVDQAYREHTTEIVEALRGGDLALLADEGDWPSAALDITGIVTRRAGLAAQQAASGWLEDPVGEQSLELLGQGLWRHGHETALEGQRALEGFGRELGKIIDANAKRARSKRARRKLTEQLWQATLASPSDPPPGLVRRFGDRASAALELAVVALAAAVRDAMGGDAARFTDPLGKALDATATASRIRSRAKFVAHQLDDAAAVPFISPQEDTDTAAGSDGIDDEPVPDAALDEATTPAPGEEHAREDAAAEPVAAAPNPPDRDAPQAGDSVSSAGPAEWVAYEEEGV